MTGPSRDTSCAFSFSLPFVGSTITNYLNLHDHDWEDCVSFLQIIRFTFLAVLFFPLRTWFFSNSVPYRLMSWNWMVISMIGMLSTALNFFIWLTMAYEKSTSILVSSDFPCLYMYGCISWYPSNISFLGWIYKINSCLQVIVGWGVLKYYIKGNAYSGKGSSFKT